MTKFLVMLPVLGLLGACDQFTNSEGAGALGGAAIGAAITPGNRVEGALLGGAVGLAAGSLVGHTASGQCLYRRSDGTEYTAAC